jgi:cellulose synthase/poly-beta-1,6-N-acetylglucosamine synthase-like glycosyltransferase
MIDFIFSTSLLLIIYIYIGYPALIIVISTIAPNNVKKETKNTTVSIVISAYNEEQYIADTVNNKLEQLFPKSALEVIVVSDGSTDKTDEIMKNFHDPRVRFIRQEPRQGKTASLNMAITHAKGEIIIFSDANSRYQSNAVRSLVDNFSDPRVGYVTGKMMYTNNEGSPIGDGCSSYMRYENFLRLYETQVNSIVGVDGGIDAMRKDLYQPMTPDQLPDFVQPLRVVEKGFRVIYDPEAVLQEEALSDQRSEYRMRIRVSLRALWALFDMRNLLNPVKYPVFSWQLISHKILRYMTWFPIIIVLVFNPLLLDSGFTYQAMFISQIFFYACVLMGFLMGSGKDLPRLISAPYYFILINAASALAFFQFIRGKKQVLWTPRSG